MGGRGDEIEVDTWVDAAGKNGMRRDWIIRDHHTKEIITRATRFLIFYKCAVYSLHLGLYIL